MQFLKSLFCLQGLDNRTRFFAISSAVYLIFIMLISAFTGKTLISLVLLLLFIPLLAFTSLRRLKDAKLNQKLVFVPNILFFLTALVIIFSEQNSSYYLLLIPISCLALLLTYPSVSKKNSVPRRYILGYFGPIDMTEYQQMTHQATQGQCRIEPTLAGGNSVNVNSESFSNVEQTTWQSHNAASSHEQNEQKIDLGEVIRLRLLNNRKTKFSIAILLIILLISVATSWFMSSSSNNEPAEMAQESVKLITKTQSELERNHPLAMPDNFTLLLSQHQGIIINWQADEVNTPLLWSQSSAKGENSCQEISFNKGKPIRTLMVEVEGEVNVANNYFASFSPLDSKALIQALAFRGSFSLCGYNFSLKGSQAALGKNKHYADWVDY